MCSNRTARSATLHGDPDVAMAHLKQVAGGERGRETSWEVLQSRGYRAEVHRGEWGLMPS